MNPVWMVVIPVAGTLVGIILTLAITAWLRSKEIADNVASREFELAKQKLSLDREDELRKRSIQMNYYTELDTLLVQTANHPDRGVRVVDFIELTKATFRIEVTAPAEIAMWAVRYQNAALVTRDKDAGTDTVKEMWEARSQFIIAVRKKMAEPN